MLLLSLSNPRFGLEARPKLGGVATQKEAAKGAPLSPDRRRRRRPIERATISLRFRAFSPLFDSSPVSTAAAMEAGEGAASRAPLANQNLASFRRQGATSLAAAAAAAASLFSSGNQLINSLFPPLSLSCSPLLLTGRPHQACHRHEGHRPHGIAWTGKEIKREEEDINFPIAISLSLSLSSRRRRLLLAAACFPIAAVSFQLSAEAAACLLLLSVER